MTIASKDLAELAEHLRGFDTPTICNAIEDALGKRMTTGFTQSAMVCAFPDLKPICGFARTATIRSAAPASASGDEMRQRREQYYRYVCAPPLPVIAVLQDVDDDPGLGAFWGEVNTNVHHGLGVEGCVTNGSIRDLDAIHPSFQLIAGRVSPSHAHVHVEAIQVDVQIFGLDVRHGDLVHADRHGACVIPAEIIEKLPGSIDLCIRREAPILEAARSDGFNVDKLVEAWSDASDIY